jgi:hypothetical protein
MNSWHWPCNLILGFENRRNYFVEPSIEQKLLKDHARWDSEHGHWLKDIEVWHRRHRDAQDIIDTMQKSMKEFSDQVEAHRSSINHHREVVRLHEAAMAWNEQHSSKHHEGDSIHKYQEEVHSTEGMIHRKLLELHQKVANDVMKMAYKFGLNV